VRELENLLHRAVALSSSETIDAADLGIPEGLFASSDAMDAEVAGPAEAPVAPLAATAAAAAPGQELPVDLAGFLDAVERDILVRALERHRFNRTAAGASMGLSLRQMRYRMARLGVVVGGEGIGADGA